MNALVPIREPVAAIIARTEAAMLRRCADQARLVNETLRLAQGHEGAERRKLIGEASAQLGRLVSQFTEVTAAMLRDVKHEGAA